MYITACAYSFEEEPSKETTVRLANPTFRSSWQLEREPVSWSIFLFICTILMVCLLMMVL